VGRLQLRYILALAAIVVAGCTNDVQHGNGNPGGCVQDCCAGSSGGGGSGGCPGPPPPIVDFPATAIFYQDISAAPVDAESRPIIETLQAIGFGGAVEVGGGYDPNFLVENGETAPITELLAIPDCDTAPVPVPALWMRAVNCAHSPECDLLVKKPARLYEIQNAALTDGAFSGTCLAVWDLTRDYWATSSVGASYGRGDGCRGVDDSGLPLAPLVYQSYYDLFQPVTHALRLTLPADRIRADAYVHPATHIGAASGGTYAVPVGARLRLKATFPESNEDSDLEVVRALKKYGAFVAGSSPTPIIASDGWALVGGFIVTGVQPSDFEVVEAGPRIDFAAQTCKRVPIRE